MNVDFMKVQKELARMPVPTTAEAIQAANDLAEQVIENADAESLECLIELAGFVSTCKAPGDARKFLVYLSENGPLVKS